MPVNSEAWFSLLWRQQKEDRGGEENAKTAMHGLREARQPAGYRRPSVHTRFPPPSCTWAPAAVGKGWKCVHGLQVRGAIYITRFFSNLVTKLLQVWQKMGLPYNEFQPMAPGDFGACSETEEPLLIHNHSQVLPKNLGKVHVHINGLKKNL